jgi:hypothetical protein
MFTSKASKASKVVSLRMELRKACSRRGVYQIRVDRGLSRLW